MNVFHTIIAILLTFESLNTVESTDEILGCGGFIKSHADIDFSRVEVKLLTKQGSLKDKTDCSPSNGYYFIPLYDKTDYILKISPPPGWSFEPEEIKIAFDGKTDMCSLGKDVNFSFKGFGITGNIEILGQTNGAKGVNVELKSESNQEIRTTISDVNGIFYFTPVIPGTYSIKVTRNKWHFEQAERTVIVKTGNTELPKNSFVVSGFDVEGKILNDEQSLINIGIALFNQKSQKTASKCEATDIQYIFSNNPDYESTPSCFSLANKNGDYLFKGVSSGKYIIKPHVLNKDIQLYIQPEYQEFDVFKDNVIIPKHFEVTGFSVVGRILAATHGWGIPNAKIKINGAEVAITHTDGSYSLKNVKAGTYRIQVEADSLQFNDQTVAISLANPYLPDIVVNAFKVCGRVSSPHSYTVVVKSSTYRTEAISQVGSGIWCTFLSSGKYIAEVLTTEKDRSLGVQFFPLQQNIEVTSSPISEILFSQLRATLTGQVRCLSDGGPKCSEITITLYSLDATGKQNGQYITAVLKGGKYSFAEVLPGTYDVTIPNLLLCWEKSTVRITVQSATETIPMFVHTGYLLSVISSHNTKMNYKMVTASQASVPDKISLVPGINSFCVPKFGQYIINFDGCHVYDDKDLPTYMFTGDHKPITVNAIKHKNGLRILSDISTTYKFLIKNDDRKEVVNLIAEPNKVDGYFAYRYDFLLKPEERIIVKPISDIMLFKPDNKEILGKNDCVEMAFTFMSSKGLVINGQIIPPISGVKISVSFGKISLVPAIETLSSNNGSFKFGPLDSNLEMEFTAFKESYVFSDFDKTTHAFKAHKLCEIIASVKDEDGKQLNGVLLSLSGAENYRKNLVTGDDGTINFHSLSPSQYYLRPMMKEYKFDPISKIIDIKDGETVNVELFGKRVAYSIFGSVNSLNGEPFPGVFVETIAEEPCTYHQEEATTEQNGNYRFRGLQPGCNYTVRLKSDNQNVQVYRTISGTQTYEIKQNDIRDVNIVAMSSPSFVDVTARVYASQNEYYKNLRIQLYKKGSADSPLYSQRIESPLNVKSRVNPGIMVFFSRIPFDGKTYLIEITTTLSDKNFKYNLPIESFIANRSSVYVELEFKPEIRSTEGELNQNSISALLLIGLITVAFFKQDLAFDLFNFIWSQLNGLVENFMNKNKKKDNRNETVVDDSEIDKLVQSINATKKKSTRRLVKI